MELQVDRVQLLRDGPQALILPGHDEGAANVTVFDKSLAKLDAERVRQRDRRGAARFGNGDDDVNVVPAALVPPVDAVAALLVAGQNALREFFSHAQAGAVDRNVVDHRVFAGEVDVLEDARRVRSGASAARRHMAAVGVREQRFAGLDVAHEVETLNVDGAALGSHHHLFALRAPAHAEGQRTDAVRIAEGDDAAAIDHRDRGVRAAATPVDAGHRGENLFVVRLVGAHLLQLVGEDVEQYFRVRFRVDVAQILAEDMRHQLVGVGQIAVVRQADAVRRVDVHGLRFGGAGRAGGWVAHMADAHSSR